MGFLVTDLLLLILKIKMVEGLLLKVLYAQHFLVLDRELLE
jgi:hypothetical protein